MVVMIERISARISMITSRLWINAPPPTMSPIAAATPEPS